MPNAQSLFSSLLPRVLPRLALGNLALRVADPLELLSAAGAELEIPLTSTGNNGSRGRSRVVPAAGAVWHLLQFSDAIDLELASALAETKVPVILWEPDRSVLPVRPMFQEAEGRQAGSTLRLRRFPLMRGYAHPALSALARTGPTLAKRLARHSLQPERAILLCSTPYFATVAERWPGPVVYWLSDLMARYEGVEYTRVRELDRQMCRAATLVCPASDRLAAYLRQEGGCPPEKILVSPNATRAGNIAAAPLLAPEAFPGGAFAPDQPVAGVIGNLAENMDWVFLRELLELTPWLSWAFVGPTDQAIAEEEQRAARAAVIEHERTRFFGKRPYRELWHFARAFTVAVLPYRQREPTFSGSSTRFYEHLAACHPILATPCVGELLSKQPLLELVSTPAAAAAALDDLRARNFDDRVRELRWETSLRNTWESRALAMRAALAERLEAQGKN